jgi:hypothetical protein
MSVEQRQMARNYIVRELVGMHQKKRVPKPEVVFAEIITRGWARVVRRPYKPPLLVWEKDKP